MEPLVKALLLINTSWINTTASNGSVHHGSSPEPTLGIDFWRFHGASIRTGISSYVKANHQIALNRGRTSLPLDQPVNVTSTDVALRLAPGLASPEGARGEVDLDLGPSPPLPSPSAPYGMYELTEGMWAATLIGIETFLRAHQGFSFVYNVI